MWDPFLMKKLIKNEICVSVNSIYMYCSLQKVNICCYCLLNSNRNTPKRVKKKKRSLKTQTWNPNTHKMLKKHCQRSFHFSSSTLSLSLSSPS